MLGLRFPLVLCGSVALIFVMCFIIGCGLVLLLELVCLAVLVLLA